MLSWLAETWSITVKFQTQLGNIVTGVLAHVLDMMHGFSMAWLTRVTSHP